MTPRLMTEADLQTVLGWAADEGWNPGLDDAAAFMMADPEGFFIGEVSGVPAAAISVVNHSDRLAFLGLYLCRPEFRGQGHGYALWHHAMGHAGDRSVGLDGVPDQQDNYRKSGFELADQTWRYEGRVDASPSDDVISATPEDAAWIAEMEAGASGYAKPGFMSAWLGPSPSRRTVVLSGRRGFATYRQCQDGFKIGPLVTPGADEAAVLIRHIAAEVEDRVIIDVPARCAELTGFCVAEGLTPTFNTARMYRGSVPQPGSTCFSVATLELG